MERADPQSRGDESSNLQQFLDYQRATLLLKTRDLGRADLNRRLPTSTLTLGGLLKHLALVEDDWIQVKFLGKDEKELEPWGSAPWDEDRDWEFHSAANDDPQELRDLYRDACARSRTALLTCSLDDLSVGVDRDGSQWNLRWVLTHILEETARHNGHADLLREAIDGSVGE
ncbi:MULTISPECIES: DinB family protein [unclassified Arthrobacter]|uniref:DinB family protein n=1 Tax=unclassified Arthrobacter TaxID=235627 RepID=UPI002E018249|nr:MULTISPECIES: DinB family protein [unclassified Arthrobacter]MEC5192379.1 putative damage-inducible protein DinB [Arthrobacter sp. MP_M4]MEC5203864.1 putative damage-inducible protein DinB [Arthrobacter sp. MP_M7]